MTGLKTAKMTKTELANLAARAMNLLASLKATIQDNGVEMGAKDEGDFWALAAMMPERSDFHNNGTVTPADLL